MRERVRRCGVLLHPTSLPSPHGIGTLGEEALRFVELLYKTKVSLWQILPLGPTGYGDSPYAARSSFAGNELLVDLPELVYDGYLPATALLGAPVFSGDRVDYGAVRAHKEPLLTLAADTFLAKAEGEDRRAYERFVAENDFWLADYSLYATLAAHYNDSRWYSQWPKALRLREEKALAAARKEHHNAIERVQVIQYFFFRQWEAVKRYANEHQISILGDLPIFVAPDSCDAWVDRHLMKIDRDGVQLAQSGVPPDAFSDEGQLWGNPVYDWPAHQAEDFGWWIRRIKQTLEICDLVRIDHFRGFAAYWEVPQEATTAIEGRWEPSPGTELFAALRKHLGVDLPIIAEDLGVITPDVEELRDSNNFPGMKILHFAFDVQEGMLDPKNPYLPHNITAQSVIYTGTHDNNTTVGWFASLDGGTQDLVRRYLECPDEEVPWQLIRHMLLSVSDDAVLPMQDWLELDASGRMNVPSTVGTSNWSWRLESLAIESWRVERLRSLIQISGRAP